MIGDSLQCLEIYRHPSSPSPSPSPSPMTLPGCLSKFWKVARWWLHWMSSAFYSLHVPCLLNLQSVWHNSRQDKTVIRMHFRGSDLTSLHFSSALLIRGLALTVKARIRTGRSPLLFSPILKSKIGKANIINEHIRVKHVFSESNSVLDIREWWKDGAMDG